MNHSPLRIVCDQTWDALAPRSASVGFCGRCKREVHACDDLATARRLSAAGACVAIPIEVARKRTPVPIPPSPNPTMTTKMGMGMHGDDSFPIVGWLVVLDGPMQNLTLQLAATTTTLGSAPPADFVLPDEAIAALHLELQTTTTGFTAHDRSEGGFVANGQPVTTHELVDNDVLQLGATRLKFKSVA